MKNKRKAKCLHYNGDEKIYVGDYAEFSIEGINRKIKGVLLEIIFDSLNDCYVRINISDTEKINEILVLCKDIEFAKIIKK